MATTTTMTFDEIESIFGRVYAELREANRENAPNSWTWYAPTLLKLAREVCTSRGDRIQVHSRQAIGDVNRPVVAYAYECNGYTLAAIHDDATDSDVEGLFRYFMGFDD